MPSSHASNTQSLDYILRSLTAGAIAGGVAKTVTAPLDRVKILFQGGNPEFMRFTGSFAGWFRAVVHIVSTKGPLALWRGHGATLLRILPYSGINFTAYEQYKKLLLPPDSNKVHPFMRILAGSLAGTTSVFLTYPLDLTRTLLGFQHSELRYRGVANAIYTIISTEGIRGLYKGFGATALGIIPYAGTSFFSYEQLKRLCLSEAVREWTCDSEGKLRLIPKLACGGLAGALAQTAAYPLDTVRRRMQLHGMAQHLPRYRHTWDALIRILQTEGIRGLYIGLSINYLKVVPSMSVSFVTYETMKGVFGIPAGKGGEI